MERDRIWLIAPLEGPRRNSIFSLSVFSKPSVVFNHIYLEVKEAAAHGESLSTCHYVTLQEKSFRESKGTNILYILMITAVYIQVKAGVAEQEMIPPPLRGGKLLNV